MSSKHPSLMVQATGSNAGKSLFVAGLCRILKRRGVRVAPFKPQNMANNAYVTEGGREIARAQALQCLAARCSPSADMNPVLLKPQPEGSAQLIVQGRLQGVVRAHDYPHMRARLLEAVLESYRRLCRDYEVILVEGAGSPAEINLRRGDIANMGFARTQDMPILMLADIERGGAIAALCGTQQLLSLDERALVCAYAINKFRGDVELFQGGLEAISERTGWPSAGVVPWFEPAKHLPPEDSLDFDARKNLGRAKNTCRVTLLRCPFLANADDFDPLRFDNNFDCQVIGEGETLPADTDIALLLGSKSVLADLNFLKRQGWDIDLKAHTRRGGLLIGLCGGYQMLGQKITDPHGSEGAKGSQKALEFLELETRITKTKRLVKQQGHCSIENAKVRGYEIHMGKTKLKKPLNPLIQFEDGTTDGAISDDGKIFGCYLHGVFESRQLRTALCKYAIGNAPRHAIDYNRKIEATIEAWARHLQKHCDVELLIKQIAGMGG